MSLDVSDRCFGDIGRSVCVVYEEILPLARGVSGFVGQIMNITVMELNKEFLGKLFEQAMANPRLRQNFDLRTSANDNSQRMLNALLPGTVVPIHRHPNSTENVLLLCGKLVEVFYDENGNEKERIHLDPSLGNYGCVVPQGEWHSVEVLEPSVIYEAKDGKYGEDGSESLG